MCVKFLLISRVIGTVLKGQKSSFNNILDCYFTTMACGQTTPAFPDGLKCRFIGPILTCSISVNKTSKSAFSVRAPFEISTTYQRLPWWFCGKESIYQCRDMVQSLGQEDPLEKEMATHSSILAWEIPWAEEPGGLQSMGSQRVGHNWAAKWQLRTIHQNRDRLNA